MGLGDILNSVLGGGKESPLDLTDMAKLAGIDLPLSGDSQRMLGDLISKGVFKDKSDFLGFIANAYMQNDLGSMMTDGKKPPESAIMDIINKSGIGKGLMDSDIKKMLVPLLITSFFSVYKFMTQRQSMKPA